MSENSPIVNVDGVAELDHTDGDDWGGFDKILTPTMRERGGKLGVVLSRVPPGRAMSPFHHHRLEDEVFYVLGGRGTLRYGDRHHPLRVGDCVSCPAGTEVAHQVINDGTEDLVYLAIGNHEPEEVCVYPDSGKVMVRSLKTVGRLERADYHDGEPPPGEHVRRRRGSAS